MDFKNLFDDDRAVSPVIGVILMVAITVILAAVIGTFVLGLGDQVQNTTPTASFGFDGENSTSNVTITHQSGEAVEGANTKVVATGGSFKFYNASSATWNDTGADGAFTYTEADIDTVSAGTSIEVFKNGGFAGETISVVWEDPNNDNSATLGRFKVPE